MSYGRERTSVCTDRLQFENATTEERCREKKRPRGQARKGEEAKRRPSHIRVLVCQKNVATQHQKYEVHTNQEQRYQTIGLTICSTLVTLVVKRPTASLMVLTWFSNSSNPTIHLGPLLTVHLWSMGHSVEIKAGTIRRTKIRRCDWQRSNTRHKNEWDATKLRSTHLDKTKPEKLVTQKNHTHVRARNGLSQNGYGSPPRKLTILLKVLEHSGLIPLSWRSNPWRW